MVDWEDLKGFYGYENRIYYNGISIHYGGNNNTVCVEMSGQGCRTFETYSFFHNFAELLHFIYTHEGFNLTRIDIAYDDFFGLLDLNTIQKALENGVFTSRFSNIHCDIPIRGDVGHTIYLGSMKSEVLFRIYDKRAERGREDLSHWVRFELQLRDKSAKAFVKALEDNGYNVGFCFYGVVNNYVRFVTATGDSNLSRRKDATWWKKFVGHSQSISVFTKKDINYNIKQVKNYVCNMAGNAVQCLINVYGIDEFQKLIDKRDIDYNAKYIRIEKQTKARTIKNPDYPFIPFSDKREGDTYEVIDID